MYVYYDLVGLIINFLHNLDMKCVFCNFSAFTWG